MRIEEIKNPIERFIAFILERERIRVLRTAGKPWPWTEDDILQDYRFTNVHREDDTVSQHYQDTVRNRYGEDPLVFPASVAYRWFNRPSTCDALFSGNRSIFESYIDTGGDITILQDCMSQLSPPYVTGSYIITGKPGYAKVDGVIYYIHHWCQKGWRDRWNYWKKDPPLLSEMYEWISSDGLGSFMRGQIIADLKYVPFMRNVKDWWIWATPGPGSLRGLNIVLERPMTESWPKGEWLTQLIRLNDTVTPMLEKAEIGRLHNQDLQNCLCEFSKYTKVARGWGRPRQTFKNRGI